MVSVCFYFQVHQPFRLRRYKVFDIGRRSDYYDEDKNRAILKKVAHKCYLPSNKVLYDLIKMHNGNFRIAFSFSGVFLEQCELYYPEVLKSFQRLVNTGCVEILDETYYHSLAFLFSKDEFKRQVRLHKEKVQKLFGVTPTVFRNTELIFNNELAMVLEDMGYEGVLAEGADHILGWRSPNFLYRPHMCKNIVLLMKNYKLSDDIAFRFSNKGWKEWPLTVSKFSNWVNQTNGNGHTINLFMDYETFGEHQWEDTGIFSFLKALPGEILRHPDNSFKTPSEVITSYPVMGEVDIHHPISWADIERDTSAWLGNKMQQEAVRELYAMEQTVLQKKDKGIIDDWRKLQTSDNFYYMCTKWFSDGDVHKYFNPYDSPYEAFIAFMNVLNDLTKRSERGEPHAKKSKKGAKSTQKATAKT